MKNCSKVFDIFMTAGLLFSFHSLLLSLLLLFLLLLLLLLLSCLVKVSRVIYQIFIFNLLMGDHVESAP